MFRYCETKQLRRNLVFSVAFSYPWLVSKPEITETLRDSLPKISALWDKKIPTAIPWYHPHPLIPTNFSLTESFWCTVHNGSPLIFFGIVRQKSLKENCDTRSIPPCPWSFSTPEVLWNAEGLRYGSCWYC